jgi:tetratricopeptide (TPR) repeat protein
MCFVFFVMQQCQYIFCFGKKLAKYFRVVGKFDDAKNCFAKATSVLLAVSDANPNDPELLQAMAGTLYDLGKLLRDQKQMEQAVALFIQAIDIQERLVTGESVKRRDLMALAHTLSSLGTLHRYCEPSKALIYLNRSLRIHEELWRTAPNEVYGFYDIGTCLSMLAKFYGDNENWAFCSHYANRALGVSAQLRDRFPEDLKIRRLEYEIHFCKVLADVAQGNVKNASEHLDAAESAMKFASAGQVVEEMDRRRLENITMYRSILNGKE